MLPLNPVVAPAAAATSGPSATATPPANPTDALTKEGTFLQLLVAQIKNQDPMNPADSTQFVGQLVQFSQLEQLLGINQGVQTLITKSPAAGSTPPASPGTPTNSINQ